MFIAIMSDCIVSGIAVSGSILMAMLVVLHRNSIHD
jgi:hypothetical protein